MTSKGGRKEKREFFSILFKIVILFFVDEERDKAK